MDTINKVRLAILLTLALCFGSTTLYAQATRTWVSGVGDDANPCSRTAPCKTFAGAISKTAAGGEIDALDPGGFGAVTITKSITIDGGGGQVASVLVVGTNGINISAGTSDIVVLKDLRIKGILGSTNGSGIKVNSVGVLHVERCDISDFDQNGIDVEVSTWAAIDVIDTVSRDNGLSGFFAQASSNVVTVSINRSTFDDNTTGVFAGSGSSVSVRDTDASLNNTGFAAQGNGSSLTLSISNSTAANNGISGILAGGGSANAGVRITGVSIFGNGAGLVVESHGSIASFGNNYNSDGGSPTAHPSPQ